MYGPSVPNVTYLVYGEEMREIRIGIIVRSLLIVWKFTARGSYKTDSILRAMTVDLRYQVLS